MRTETISIFKFTELSEDAKQTAIDEYRSKGHPYDWSEENVASLNAFISNFPAKKSNGRTLELESDGSDIENLKGVRLATYIINNYGNILFKPKFIIKTVSGTAKSYYSKIQKDTSCVLTGYCIDDDLLQPIYDFLKKPNKETDWQDLVNECSESWRIAVQKDEDWQDSDDYISDYLTSNEYEFTQDGKIFN